MASTYVNDLRLNEMATGDQSGSWGTVTNTNLELISEAFGYGTEAITTNADTHTTTIADGSTDPARSMFLKYTGTLDSACTITIGPNTVNKLWFIENATSGSQNIIITSGSGANITIPAGQTKAVYSDGVGSGAAMVDAFASLNVVDMLVDDDLTVTDDLTVGGIVSLADGTAGAPSLTNTGDVNAGLFFSAADTLAFSAGGTAQFTMADGVVAPVTDSDVDLGTSSLYFKNAYIDTVTTTGVITAASLDISGNIDVDGTSNLDAVDIDGAVQIDATFTSGVDGQGYDTKFFGDTASAYMLWDTSADDLILGGAAGLIVPEGQITIGSTAVTSSAADLNQLDGEVAKTAGKESIWIPAAAMYPSTTNPCSDLTQVETTALRPDLKVLDFAAAADDFAQFSVAFPKSWNLGTITYQPFWTVTGTNTGTMVWQLGGVAITNDESIDTAFGTLVATTALAHSGTSNDLMVSAESGAVTIAGSPADNDQCFFQINNDASASGQTGAARLLGIKLFFTTDAANDG
tara:strand:+ start:2160 stop:3719 length:1560 start_codon:yes stop_codon:yes gene_type:complete